MRKVDETDYASLGVTIRTAMLKAGKINPPTRTQPLVIRWKDKSVQTVDIFPVPRTGIVRGEFLYVRDDIEQGFDIKVDGWLNLPNGEKISLLRTWNDPQYEPIIEYSFHSQDGVLRIWNVYKMHYPGGQMIEEKWTENSGMWVEQISPFERIYHCSHGMAKPPDFTSLVFKITILGHPANV